MPAFGVAESCVEVCVAFAAWIGGEANALNCWYSLPDSNRCYRRERAEYQKVTTEWSPGLADHMADEVKMARPERLLRLSPGYAGLGTNSRARRESSPNPSHCPENPPSVDRFPAQAVRKPADILSKPFLVAT